MSLLEGLLGGSLLQGFAERRRKQALHINVLKRSSILSHAMALVGMCLSSQVQQIIIGSNGHHHVIVVFSFPIGNVFLLVPTT